MDSRWASTASSIWIQATTGGSYAFSIYSPLLKSSQSYDQSTLDMISVFKDIGANAGIISGLLYSSTSKPWLIHALGSLQCFLGYFFIWSAVVGLISPPSVSLMCFFMFLAAHAQTFFNTANVVTAVNNFRDYKGTIVGIMKNLEPWLVSKVRVTGGVSIFSGIAKGLPVSEDLDISIDIDQLKAPPLLRKRIVLLVGVFSTGNNFERRMALRRTWMQYEAVRSGSVAVRFIIGFHKNAEVNLDLWKEAQAYGDIQFMPFVDYYSLISLKTIAVCILGLFKLEDVAMGIWIDTYKNIGHEIKYISDDRFYNTVCDMDYILAHYQNPRKVLCLWEKLQKEHQAACCE